MMLAASMLALWLASSVLAAAAFAAWVALGGHGGVALAAVAGVLGPSPERADRRGPCRLTGRPRGVHPERSLRAGHPGDAGGHAVAPWPRCRPSVLLPPRRREG